MVNVAIIVVAGLIALAIVAAIVYAIRSKAASDQARLALANEHGWTYSAGGGGTVFELAGTNDGVDWVLRAKRSRSSSSSGTSKTTTKWRTVRPRGGPAVFAGPKLPDLVKAGLGQKVVLYMLKAILGDDAEQLQGLETVNLGSITLGRDYDLVSTDGEAAKAWIEPVAADLVAFPGGDVPVVGRWRDELFIQVDGAVDDPEVLLAMIGVGTKLAQADPVTAP